MHVAESRNGTKSRKTLSVANRFTVFIAMKILLTLKELLPIVELSEPTIRRRVNEAKEGKGTFPLPISGCGDGKKCLWRREDIENWLNTQKPEPLPDQPTYNKRIKKSIRTQLIALGMGLDKDTS